MTTPNTPKPTTSSIAHLSRSARARLGQLPRVSGLLLTGLLLSASGCGKLAEQMAKVDAAGDNPAAGGLDKQAPAVRATRVEVAEVSATSAEMSLSRPGEVEGSKEADVGSSLGGLVESVRVSVGSKVGAGSTLARIDTEMQRAQADLANIEVADAQRELTRLRKLGNSVAGVRVDQAQTRLERGRAQARLAKIQVDRSVIRAPFSGVVTEVFAEKGEVLPPGGRVARVVRLDPIIVSVAVSDRDLAGLVVGDSARIRTAASGEDIDGEISRIEPTAGLKTRSFKVEIQVRNKAGKLKPGMIASVDFRRTFTDERIILPQDLLVTRREGNGVFVVGLNGRAEWRGLQLGAILGDQVVIEAGLEVGERIVVRGHRGLAAGDELLIAREGRCCSNGRVSFGESNTNNLKAGDKDLKVADAPADKAKAAAAAPAKTKKKPKRRAKPAAKASAKGAGGATR